MNGFYIKKMYFSSVLILRKKLRIIISNKKGLPQRVVHRENFTKIFEKQM
jgi:hypothetical protein